MGRGAAMMRLTLTVVLAGATAAQAAFIVPRGVSGDLGYSYTETRDDQDNSSSSNLLTGRINGNAYLWQPWFATLGGTLALSHDQSRASGGGETDSNYVTGEVDLSVLPMSRFPFTAHYSVSDSHVDSSGVNDNPLLAQSTARHFSRNQLRLGQGYYGERYRFNLRYNNDEAKSDSGERSLNEGYGFDYSLRLPKQNLAANAYFSTQSNNQNSNESDNQTFTVNHNYYPSTTTTLDSQASHVQSDNRYGSSGFTQEVNTTIDQVSTSLNWRSATRPLRLHGALRVHQMEYLLDDGSSTAIENGGFNSSLGASYQFTDRLLGSVNGQYSESNGDGSDSHSHGESASLNYASERYTLSGFDYGWNGSLGGSNQGSDESSAQSLNLSLGHGANRSWRLGRRSNLRLSLNQSVQESYTESSGTTTPDEASNTRRLAHGLGLGWSASGGGGNTMAQLTLSDSRGIIGDESYSQMANAQLSRSQNLSSRSSLNGNLSWQASHNVLEGTPDYGIGQSASASASYRFARPFTLARVNFLSDLRLTDNQPAVGEETQELFWDNRLTHEIGMMRSSLSLTVHDRLGSQTTVLRFKVKRVF
ncbi:MAG: hypothetical protein OQL08_03950 [Gammaproteobacteria bacterium]|nr:hypothetical protein [Gammaproteobacteria bacterium]